MRYALGLQRAELRALLDGQDRLDLGVLRVAKLLHLRALRLHRGTERIELRRVIRILGGLELLERLLRRFEERLVRVAGALFDVRDLRLLRIGEVQLLCVRLAEAAAAMAAPIALPFFAVVHRGEGQRCTERQNCHCRNCFLLHDFPLACRRLIAGGRAMRQSARAVSFPSDTNCGAGSNLHRAQP
jgi:hypothetical protein